MKNKKRAKGWLWIGSGLLLIAAALSLTVHNLSEDWRAGRITGEILVQFPEPKEPGKPASPTSAEIPDYILNPNMEMPAVEIDGHEYTGCLEIPTLGLSLPVMSQWSYPGLKIAPGRYQGSVYNDSLIIAAHNYSSHFGNLKQLKPGDSVSFTDMDGIQFQYQVAETEILGSSAVEEMNGGEWDLSLFTCTYGGESRVTVRCERVGWEANEAPR